jgi:hypothetical protein
MGEVNPYQQPVDESSARPRRRAFDAAAAGVPREPLRVILGLVALLGATLGFVASSGVLGVIDRFAPVSFLVFSDAAVRALIGVFVVAAAALAWLSWTLQKKGYPRRKLSMLAGAGWAFGLLCLAGIVHADTVAEEGAAEAICTPLAARQGVRTASTAAPVDRCKAVFLRCRRSLRRQPGEGELTYDAEMSRMNACMESSLGSRQ